MRAVCSISGCGGRHEARGWCAKHYQRFKAHGDPLAIKINRRDSLQEAFRSGYKEAPSGCWLWFANLNPNGYGVVTFNGRKHLAHRVAFELSYGAVPNGRQINHRCDVRACVNPAHLYAGTQRQNVLDAVSRGRWPQAGGKPRSQYVK